MHPRQVRQHHQLPQQGIDRAVFGVERQEHAQAVEDGPAPPGIVVEGGQRQVGQPDQQSQQGIGPGFLRVPDVERGHGEDRAHHHPGPRVDQAAAQRIDQQDRGGPGENAQQAARDQLRGDQRHRLDQRKVERGVGFIGPVQPQHGRPGQAGKLDGQALVYPEVQRRITIEAQQPAQQREHQGDPARCEQAQHHPPDGLRREPRRGAGRDRVVHEPVAP